MISVFKVAKLGLNAFTNARVAAAKVLNSEDFRNAVVGAVDETLTAFKASGLQDAIENFKSTDEFLKKDTEDASKHLFASCNEVIEKHLGSNKG